MNPKTSLKAATAASVLVLAGAMTPCAGADQNLVARGEYLARAGDCTACHSAPGGKPYAGGVAIATPFGAMYTPNITPDKDTGIGAWSDADFYKAMHEGIGHDGEYLYPAFPYPWFTKITRDDVSAIKAYLDTLPPVHAPKQPNHLMFPFNVRLGLGGWNAAFFHAGEFKADPAASAELNRGAYLVEGLGHCGDCHTPKGVGMEPDDAKAFAGGSIDNWYAPNITSDKERGIGGWSDQDLVTYLKTGTAPGKGVVVGPMAQVVHESLAYMTDSDVQAIVAYLKATPPIADYQEARPSALRGPDAIGAQAYLNNCAFCHQPNGKGINGAIPPLAGNGVVQAKGPEDIIRVILGGRQASDSYAPMPAVGDDLSDQQIADITNYVRTAWDNAAPASADAGLVAKIRAETFSMLSGNATKEGGSKPCESQDGEQEMTVSPVIDPNHQIDGILHALRAETMLPAVSQVLARARAVDPHRSQADLINGLMLDYCRVLAGHDGIGRARSRQMLNQFGQLVYTELASGGKD
jgi:mono/diheme cytochrome c family protein